MSIIYPNPKFNIDVLQEDLKKFSCNSEEYQIIIKILNNQFNIDFMKNKYFRENTLINYPKKYLIKSLSDAGFYYFGIDCSVICIFCGVVLNNFDERDDPYDIHRHVNPDCEYIKIYTLSMPKINQYQEYFFLDSRISSLKNKGGFDENTSSFLAECGFFINIDKNYLTCYSCGIEICKNVMLNDLWKLHFKMTVSLVKGSRDKICSHILSNKGYDFMAMEKKRLNKEYLDIFNKKYGEYLLNLNLKNENNNLLIIKDLYNEKLILDKEALILRVFQHIRNFTISSFTINNYNMEHINVLVRRNKEKTLEGVCKIPFLNDYDTCIKRLNSFLTSEYYLKSGIDLYLLANAGFYYYPSNISSSFIRCYVCGLLKEKITRYVDPMLIHYESGSMCEYLCLKLKDEHLKFLTLHKMYFKKYETELMDWGIKNKVLISHVLSYLIFNNEKSNIDIYSIIERYKQIESREKGEEYLKRVKNEPVEKENLDKDCSICTFEFSNLRPRVCINPCKHIRVCLACIIDIKNKSTKKENTNHNNFYNIYEDIDFDCPICRTPIYSYDIVK